MIDEKVQKKILKDGLQNEVRPYIVALKNAVAEGNELLRQIYDKEIPEEEPVDFTPVIEKLDTLVEEVKKKEEYTYEIKIDPALRKKLTGKQGIRGARGLRGLQGKAGKDGKSPTLDIEKIKKSITPIKGKDYFDGERGEKGKDGTDITATQIRNKLESLTGKQRLSAKAIKGIEELIKGEVTKAYRGGSNIVGGGSGDTGGGTGTSPNFSDNEVPSGTINGSNVTFTLLHTPLTGTLHLYYNGLRQTPTSDYSIVGSVITLVSAPIPTDVLLADYKY